MTTSINVYGPIGGEGIPKRHDTTYLECEIPEKLENKLYKMIEKEVKAFEKKCKFLYCKKGKK